MFLYPLIGSVFLTGSLKHNCMIMKQKLWHCFLSEDVLSNRVSLFRVYVMIDNPQNKKGYCSIPSAVWVSIEHICDALPHSGWPNQSRVSGGKIFCHSARAFPSFWKCKWIHTSSYTYFEMTWFDSQATIHGSPKQDWGRPSPHPSHHPKTNLPSQCLVRNKKFN